MAVAESTFHAALAVEDAVMELELVLEAFSALSESEPPWLYTLRRRAEPIRDRLQALQALICHQPTDEQSDAESRQLVRS